MIEIRMMMSVRGYRCSADQPGCSLHMNVVGVVPGKVVPGGHPGSMQIHLCLSFPSFPSPAFCLQTADNWATDNVQCLVPGYGAPSLFLGGAPTSYPVTYDRKQSCNQVVFTSTLVDKMNTGIALGQLYAWKVRKTTESVNGALPPGGITDAPHTPASTLCSTLSHPVFCCPSSPPPPPHRTTPTTCTSPSPSTPRDLGPDGPPSCPRALRDR